MTKQAIVAGPITDSLLQDYAENLSYPDLGNVELSSMLVADLGDSKTAYRELRENEKERIIQESYQGGGVSLGTSNFTDGVVSLLTYGIVGGAIYYATDDDDDDSDKGFKAVNDRVDLFEGGDPVAVNVLANDRTGPAGGDLQIVAVDTTTGNGTEVNDLGNGEFSLDIGDDYQQLLPGDKIKDTFTYTIENEAGEQSTGTVNITINGDIDSAPEVTGPVSASTEESTSVTIDGIQVSDIDIGDRDLEVVISASNGTLEASGQDVNVRGDGSDELTLRGKIDDINSALQTLAYTPDDGFSGEDTLQIAASDDTSTVPASIAITVTPDLSQSITAEDDSATVEEGGNPVTVNVVDNDSFEGDVTVTVAAATANGIAVTNNNDGTITLDIGDGFGQLLPEESATDTLTYTIEDELGQQSSATIDITVAGTTNDDPVNTAPSSLTTSTNTLLDIDGLSVSDIDNDVLDLELDVDDGILSVIEGEADVSGNDSGSLTISGSQAAINAALQTLAYTPNDDFEGSDTLEIQTTDGNSTASSTVDIDVQADAVALSAEDDSVALEEAGEPVTVDLLANDSFDGERGNLTLTIADTTPSGITITNNGDGTVSFDPGANFATLLPGESVQETLSYQLTGQNNATSSASVLITVTGAVNDAPEHVLPNEPTGDTNSDVDLSALQVNDIDAGDEILTTTITVDQGTLSVNDSGSGVSGNMTSTLTLSGELQQINNSLQSLTYIPETDFAGEIELSIETSDGLSTVKDTKVIKVDALPFFLNNDFLNISEGDTTSTINVIANDTFEGPEDSITVLAPERTQSGVALINNNDGTLTLDIDREYQSLLPDQAMQDSFTYQLTDQSGNTGTAEVAITITGTLNDAPSITAPDALQTQSNTPIAIDSFEVSDPDIGESVFNVQLSVAFGTLSSSSNAVAIDGNNSSTLDIRGKIDDISNALQQLTYAPDADYFGQDTLTFVSSDGENSVVTQVDIEILRANTPPQADDDQLSSVADHSATTIDPTILASNDIDADGDSIKVVDVTGVSVLGAAVAWDINTGTIQYDPTVSTTLFNASKSVSDSFDYLISDGFGGFDTASATFAVVNSVNPHDLNEYFIAKEVENASDTDTNGLYSFLEFDGDSDDGSGQTWINLDALFDSLGFSNADRAGGEGFQVIGSSLFVDLDNDNGTGANGGFEYEIATIANAATVSGTFDNADVIAGTEFVV